MKYFHFQGLSKVQTNVPLLNSSDAVKRALLLGRSYTKLEAGCEQCLGFDLLVSELTHFENNPLLLNYLSVFSVLQKVDLKSTDSVVLSTHVMY